MKNFRIFFKRIFDLDTPIGRLEMWGNFIIFFLLGFCAFYIEENMCFDSVCLNINFFSTDIGFCVFMCSLICLVISVFLYYVNKRNNNTEKADKFGMFSMIFIVLTLILGTLTFFSIFGDTLFVNYISEIILILCPCWLFFALLRRLTATGYTKEMILKDFLKISILFITFLIFLYIIAVNSDVHIENRWSDDLKISLACFVFIGCYFVKYIIVAVFFKDKFIASEKKYNFKEKIKCNLRDMFKGIYLFITRIFDFKGISGRSECFIPMCAGVFGLIFVFVFFDLCSIFDSCISSNCGLMDNDNYYQYLLNNFALNINYHNIIGILILLGIILFLTPLVIRRLRSAGLNPWWALGQLVFPLNIMVYLYCILCKNEKN